MLGAVVVAVAAAGGTAVALHLTGDDGNPRAEGVAATPSVPATDPAPGASGSAATSSPPPAPSPAVTTPRPPAVSTPPGVPAGYRTATVSGVSLLVPESWVRTTDSSGNVAFQSSDGASRIVVRVLRNNTADPYAEQAGSESATKAAYGGYRRLELTRGTVGGGDSATWEYTYTGEDGQRFIRDVRWRAGRDSLNLWIAVPGTFDRDRARTHLQVALDSMATAS